MYDDANASQILLFRMGSSEYASWQGFRCDGTNATNESAPCEGIKVSSADMKTNFASTDPILAPYVADTLFSNAEMTWSGYSPPTTKFSKLIVDDEFTSDTT